jgi:hypothetical protein
MIEPHVHLGYAPRGPGLLYALLHFSDGADVYGWFIGGRDGEFIASYFMLQDYHAARETVFYRSAEDDVHGAWLLVEPRRSSPQPQVPVPEPLRHELSRLQSEFTRHWLFFGDDPDPQARAEARALNERELSVRRVNIQASRLSKLRKAPAVWRYDSPNADVNVLVYLSQRWPLDHQAEA